MSTLEELGMIANDDDVGRRTLAVPIDRFVNEGSISVRVAAAIARSAATLGR